MLHIIVPTGLRDLRRYFKLARWYGRLARINLISPFLKKKKKPIKRKIIVRTTEINDKNEI